MPFADQITLEFVDEMKKKQNMDYESFVNELSRLSLECKLLSWYRSIQCWIGNKNVCFWFPVLCLLAFDLRLNSFSEKERRPESRSTKLIEAAEDINDSILPLDQGFQLWRFYETKIYKKFRIAQEYMERSGYSIIMFAWI